MPETLTLTINGRPISVPHGAVVAVALAMAGEGMFRRSVLGEARGPLCGMGICMECRVTIDGRTQRRGCQTLCEAGMEVRTDE